MVETGHPAGEVCRNCGQVLDGPFCAECGQAEHDGRHPTIGHFFHDLVHEFVHVDGTIFRTIQALFFQPGKLTQEYWAGHIVSWIRPIRLFLVIAAIHLLLSKGVGPMNLLVQIDRSPNGDLHFDLNDNPNQFQKPKGKLIPEEQRQELTEEFKKSYDSVRYGAFLVFGFVSWVLYRRKQPYFVNHIIAGLHFYSFWYALGVLASFVTRLYPPLGRVTLLALPYLFFTLWRLFQEHWGLRVVKTLILYIVLIVVETVLYLTAASWVMHHAKLQ